MIILLLFAALAGLVTVLSPCILPVLPILLSGGIGQGHQRALGIIIGLILSFAFFTLSLTAIVHATGVSPDFLRYIAFFIIGFFGCTMLFPKLGDWFAKKTNSFAHFGNALQTKSAGSGTGFLSGFILGVALGLIWTPCAGPILGTITTLVATNSISWSIVLITLAYSIGAALPMFLIAYGGNKIIGSVQGLAHYSELIRKIFGALMICSAFALFFHFDVVLQQLTLKYFPSINIEGNQTVKAELAKLAPEKNKDFVVSDNNKSLAPDFVGIQKWFNSEPLSMSQLRGKVVLIDFWTYSCINCIRTMPHLKEWYTKYKDKGFEIIGIHTPEFEFEKNFDNIQSAIDRFEIKYPVGADNDFKTWQNYNNHYWPAHYLVDQEGRVVETHFGEGEYLKTENAIRKLLGLEPIVESTSPEQSNQKQTPETYLGYKRGKSYGREISLQHDVSSSYAYTQQLAPDQVGLKGNWIAHPTFIQANANDCSLDLNFIGSRVYLVMSSEIPASVSVSLDGKPVPTEFHTIDMNSEGKIAVSEARMYDILDLKNDTNRHMLILNIPSGVECYAFTFGSGKQ